MTTYIALLRAVNVGGTGKLPMADLKTLCRDAGFGDVRTYIASGNVVFCSEEPAPVVQKALERRLRAHAGKPVGVLIRTAAEMQALLAANPFADRDPRYTVAIFLDRPPPRDTLKYVTGQNGETLHLGKREIYVWYPAGQGRSKLHIPAAESGTARNMNTIANLAAMAPSG